MWYRDVAGAITVAPRRGTDGSNLWVLTNGEALTPNWTPDGSKIIFYRNPFGPDAPPAPNQLYMMNADGTDIQQLTNTQGHNLFANPGYLRLRTGTVSLHAAKIAAPRARTAGVAR